MEKCHERDRSLFHNLQLTPRESRLTRDVHVRHGKDALPVPDATVEPVPVDASGQGHHLACRSKFVKDGYYDYKFRQCGTFDQRELHGRLRVKVELDLALPLLVPLQGRGRGGSRIRRPFVGSVFGKLDSIEI